MIDLEATEARKVEDLKEGDLVDLESCPFLRDHPSAEYEYAVVGSLEGHENDGVCVGYEGVNCVCYERGTTLRVAKS